MRGGVGNQLFQLCAGLFFSEIHDAEIELDFAEVYGNQHNGCSVAKTYLISEKINQMKFGSRIKIKNVRNSNYNLYEKPRFFLRNSIIQNQEFGEDKRLESMPKTKLIKGYFQSSKYIDYLLTSGLLNSHDFRPVDFTQDGLDLIKHIKKNSPIILHIRSGDYAKHIHTLGILSSNYYSDALSRFDGYRKRQIMLVTDSKIHAQYVLHNAGISANYFDITEKLHPIELIYVLSHANDFIIANSTFSWWAAKLSEQKGTVVCPEIWFKGLESPKAIKPLNWASASSHFFGELPDYME